MVPHIAGAIRRTPVVISLASRRTDTLAVLGGSTIAYAIVYLWAIQDLTFRLGTGWSVMVVDRPASRMLEPAPGTFAFEPIAVLSFELGVLLFSPINLALGLFLAGLVGLNITLSYLAITQPKSCGLGTASGFAAAIPALLAGSACCAPVLLLVLGIMATGTILAFLSILLPLGFLLLLLSLVYVANKIDPLALEASV